MPDELLEDVDNFDLVSGWLDTLPENEREIINLRFGLRDMPPQTPENIGSVFGLTRERIRQIEVKALEKLRQKVESAEPA